MRSRKLWTIARRWWPSEGGDRDWTRVQEIIEGRRDGIPALLRMLVRTAPEGGLPFLGTALIEDLIHAAEDEKALRRVLSLVLAAGLTRAETFEVLSGVLPRLLESIDARTTFSRILSSTQLRWLLDDDSKRATIGGRAVADGDGVRVIPGGTEWERRYLDDRDRLEAEWMSTLDE